MDPEIASAIAIGALRGLDAAHEATDDHGDPLGIVHRDVSPQNILVGEDGSARVADFGIARVVGRAQTTNKNVLKGKLGYMSPEQLQGQELDRRADLWALSVTLWESLTCRRLFGNDGVRATVETLLDTPIDPPS